MRKYEDITRVTLAPYKLAESIKGGHYSNILYYEFHSYLDEQNPVFESSRLSSFQERSKGHYSNVIGYADDFEAVIDVAVKLGGQWFIIHECGANYYLGFGPQGILALRQACTDKNVPIFVFEQKLENWLINQEQSTLDKEKNEFEMITNIMRNMFADFERRTEAYKGLNEESLRDRLLAPINAAVDGRANGEAKNGKGKTDILIRTQRGNNEFIFELKVWKGIESLKEAIEQLSGYLVSNSNECGIVMFCYVVKFEEIISKIKEYLLNTYTLTMHLEDNPKEFRFKIESNINVFGFATTTVMLVNLYNK